MTDFLRSLASSDGFVPHGTAYQWDPALLWLHLASDALTGLAYWAIPPALFVLVWKARKEIPDDGPYARGRGLPYEWMFLAFAVFIVACGTTHLLAVWTIWEPRYWLSGGAKAVTAVASVATAIALPPLIPRAIQLLRDARDSEARRTRLEVANRELEALSERLKEADRLKSRLVANVSHELRTPLSLILGPAEELLRKDGISDEVRDGLEVMQRSARSLLSQVDDLLDAARLDLDQTTATFEDVELAGMVRQIAGGFEALARSRDIDLIVEAAAEPLPVRVDPEMMEHVFLNLLSNAFKFTPEGGSIRIVLDTGDVSGSIGHGPAVDSGEGVGGGVEARDPVDGADGAKELVLEIRDSGPGVPESARPVIFEPFRQAEGGSTRRHGGTGLGLSLARQFAEAQGGSIDVEDAPEGGAAFRVRLPYRPASGEVREETSGDPGRAVLLRARLETAFEGGAEGSGAGGSTRSRGREAEEDRVRIEPDRGDRPGKPSDGRGSAWAGEVERATTGDSLLLVEDDPGLREFLVPVLARTYTVRAARDGIEALEILEDSRPDLILSDMMMPRMDGEALVREIRKRSELARVPIIILTAKAEPDLVARILQLGAQDYLLKPIGIEELRARIENHLDLARTRNILQDELATRENRLRFLADEATRRKRRLETLVHEKSVLVQELHHRVKGNLQTITSLLNLQARRLDDSGARDVLHQSRGRIAAMALLHERLYQTDDPTETDMSAYVRSLVRDVFQSWDSKAARVGTDLDIEPVRLDAERAVSCGLLLHELMTNALRHGYSADDEGTIQVRLGSQDGDGKGSPDEGGPGEEHLTLTVRDDGGGFPAGLEPESADSLGLSLVRALVAQLEGEAEVESGAGAGVRWIIRFPRRAREISKKETRDDG